MGKIKALKDTNQDHKDEDDSCIFKENEENKIDSIVTMLSFFVAEVNTTL